MASLATPYISTALSRLRGGVNMCCMIAAIALIAQILIWAVASFLDVRYTVLEEQTTPATVVSAAAVERAKPIGVSETRAIETAALDTETAALNPNRVATKYDRVMEHAFGMARSAGILAILLMLPLLAVGVMLAAGSATPGIDMTVSAFMWSLVVALLILPIGQHIGLPWSYGGLSPYAYMTHYVDLNMTDGKWGSPVFYARFLLLPLACLVGVGVVGLRFSNGVNAGIIPKEDMRLDPALEREAANIKASSLIGGRTSAALRAVTPASQPAPVTPMGAAVQPAPSLTAVTSSGAGEVRPGMLQPTAGESPKRLI